MSALCAHPAAAIPLTRFGFVLSALIIGSIAPDFLYFLPLTSSEHFGHTPMGLFLFCLPSGMIALWIFHSILKYPLFSLLPDSHQQRVCCLLDHFHFGSGRHILLILCSLFLGACTHILWDSCTHYYGWTVQHLPFLSVPLLRTSQGTLKLYKVLQHSGTVVGTLVILYWCAKWLQTAPIGAVPPALRLSNALKLTIIGVISLLASLIGSITGYVKVSGITDLHSFSYFVVFTARAGISSLSVELFVFSIIWQVFRRKNAAVLKQPMKS